MLVDIGRSGFLAQARSNPDKLWQVMDKVATDDFLIAIDSVLA